MIIQPQGLTEQRYWQLRSHNSYRLQDRDEYVEVFRELFSEAVRCRLQGTSLTGSMLSGGMDLSAIVGMGRKVSEEEGLPLLHAIAAISNIQVKIGRQRTLWQWSTRVVCNLT